MRNTFILLMFIALLLGGCNRHKGGGNPSETTQTIPPAAAQPAPTGTDAMTQTVEVEDSRSEGDGGTLTTSPPAPPTAKKGPPGRETKPPIKKKTTKK